MELIVKKSAPLVPVMVKAPKPRIKVKKEPIPTVLPTQTVAPAKAVEPVVTPKVEKAPKVKVVENIKHVVEAPKVIDTVDLTKFQKPSHKVGPQIGKPATKVATTVPVKEAPKAEKPKHKNTNHIVWRNFPIEYYDAILAIVKAANVTLGKDVVTISKVAKIDYVVKPEYGSIWYSCGNAAFREHFRKPYEMMYLALEFGVRRITKKEAIELPMNSQITMAYIADNLSNMDSADMIDNIKIIGNNTEGEYGKGIWYKGVNDPTNIEYFIPFDSINNDGSFNDGVQGETVYLYVDIVE